MLSFHSISLKIEEREVFQKFSISFLFSTVTFITGRNGAGKSSLLKIIAGLQAPSTGSITYGKDNTPISKISQPYCTYIPHSLGIKLELTVKENMDYWSQIYNSSKQDINCALSLLNLHSYLGKNTYTLSRGTIQKLSLLRTLLSQGPIYLLDEIETYLDFYNLKLLISLIEIKRKNGIIFIATNKNPYIKNSQTLHISKTKSKIYIYPTKLYV